MARISENVRPPISTSSWRSADRESERSSWPHWHSDRAGAADLAGLQGLERPVARSHRGDRGGVFFTRTFVGPLDPDLHAKRLGICRPVLPDFPAWRSIW